MADSGIELRALRRGDAAATLGIGAGISSFGHGRGG
jgi:hypothetical protein